MTLIEEATAYVVGAGSGTSSCIDEFARTDSTRWGDSPICCLPWQASTHGSHSVDGALAHQSGVGISGGEEPTDWLGLTAWTGTALEFLIKLKVNAGESATVAILIGRQVGTGADGPVFDANPVYRWEVGFGTNVGGDVLATDDQGLTAHATSGGTPIISAIAGRWVWARCRLEEDHVKLRVWLDGSAEPGPWSLDAGGVFINPFHFLTNGLTHTWLGNPLGLANCDLFAFRDLFSSVSAFALERLEFVSGLDCGGPCAGTDQVSSVVSTFYVPVATGWVA